MYYLEKEEKDNYNRGFNRLDEKLLNTRTITIFGEIDQRLAERVSKELLALDAINNEPIKIFINSQGGHVEAGDTIHDMIKFVESEVKIIATGWVASAGVNIYLAAEKENRLSLTNTRFMIHQPLGGVQGQATDILIEMEELQKIKERINNIISEATGKTLEEVEKDTDRNYWLSAKEAIDYGLVGSIINKNSDLK